jgi:hypothetical protein
MGFFHRGILMHLPNPLRMRLPNPSTVLVDFDMCGLIAIWIVCMARAVCRGFEKARLGRERVRDLAVAN